MQFLKNMSWIGASFALAKGISSLVNIAAGRMLGPGEYGKINILVSIGAIISPFVIAGMNYSIIKYGAIKEERDRVFCTAALVFPALTLLTGSFVVFFRTALGILLGISVKMLLLALLYAVATSAFLMASSMQQSLGDFSKRGLSEIVFSLLLAVGFFTGILYLGRVYDVMAWAYIAAFSLPALYWLLRIGGSVTPGLLDKKRFFDMSEYGAYYFGVGVGSFLIFNVQSLVLNAFLTPREVGIYAAYNTATIGAAGYLNYALATVLFPKATASTNRKRLWDMCVRSWKYLAPAAVLLFVLAEALILTLMGKNQYGMDPQLMLLFALCGTLMLVQSSLTQIVFSEGVKAFRLTTTISLGTGVFNFIVCLLLIPHFKIAGAAVAFILTYAFMLAWLWKMKDPYIQKNAADME
jgi:O-antigen/teichoic acid export membrane protein